MNPPAQSGGVSCRLPLTLRASALVQTIHEAGGLFLEHRVYSELELLQKKVP